MYRKIIAVFMAAMVVATTCAVPSFATDYQSTYNFWNWLYDNGGFVSKSIASTADSVCSLSDDGLHHSTQHQKRAFTGDGREEDEAPIYDCICDVCGQTFEAVATDLANSYDNGSDGYQNIDSSGRLSGFGAWELCFINNSTAHYYGTYGLSIDDVNSCHVGVTVKNDNNPSFSIAYRFSTASDCSVVFDGAFEYLNIGSSEYEEAFQYFSSPSGPSLGNGTLVDGKRTFNATAGAEYLYRSVKVATNKQSGNVYFKLPSVYIQLADPQSKFQQIPINIGGSVQYTDDNSNNKIYDAEFMDFSTNEYHNPVTDYSTKVDNWEYDYSTRTYTGYTENGEVKIMYGDEYMSVTENGNIYNYYYSAPSGSGSGSGGDSSGDDDGKGLFGKIGELLGTLLGGLIDLVTGVLSGILDSLISLVEMTIEKLGSVVNLFGSFGDALRALWSWLPEDIITILSAGVSVVIFAAVLKLFI